MEVSQRRTSVSNRAFTKENALVSEGSRKDSNQILILGAVTKVTFLRCVSTRLCIVRWNRSKNQENKSA